MSLEVRAENLDLEVDVLNDQLAGQSPEQILLWARDKFGDRLAMQSSMQKTGGVLMHMASRVAPEIAVLFVDTGVLFPETLDVRDEYIRRYGVQIETILPAQSFDEQRQEYGRDLYLCNDEEGSPGYRRCCELRKEIPFLGAVSGRFDVIIGGLTRTQGGARKNTRVLNRDPRFGGYKLYPLAFWTEEQVDAYSREHDLPVHPLYAYGYASIGCRLCTTPIYPGEEKRAGRWRHIREGSADPDRPLYCGINFEDQGSGI